MMDDTRTITLPGRHGRDQGKTFHVNEIEPLEFAGYVLRLVSALRVDSYEELLDKFAQTDATADAPGGAEIDTVMRVLQGADPHAVHGLITDLLTHVDVSPDPKHPGARRPLQKGDMRELRTLGDVLVSCVKLNFAPA